jgi:hypothetical protein
MSNQSELAQLASVFAGSALSNRNRIINGDMRIDQRNGGTSVTVNSSGNFYAVDRFFSTGQNTDGVFTAQQSSVAPAGFYNSLLATVTTADTSVGATQQYLVGQAIEGLNIADLGWGTSNAQTVTLSFWVRSSLTGSFGGSVMNSAFNRSNPFSYTISSADTWEYKTVTIAGDTSGTWLATNGVGIRLYFSLGAGSTYVGTAGSWASSFLVGVTGQTNLIATNGATFYLTGVQLEIGDTSTPFEHELYSVTLQKCQRYFCKIENNTGSLKYFGILQPFTSSNVFGVLKDFPAEMRATPTVAQSGTFGCYIAGSADAGVSTTIGGLAATSRSWITTGWGGGSGLVAGYASVTYWNDGAYLTADAEL